MPAKPRSMMPQVPGSGTAPAGEMDALPKENV